MLRLINYFLLLITITALLIIVIPFGVSMREVQLLSGDTQINILNPAAAYWNPGSMLPGPIVFMIISCALLPVQQMLWFKRVQKDNQYPIDQKWLEKYKGTLWFASFTIAVPFLFFIGVWLASTIPYVDHKLTYDEFKKAFDTKKIVYIVALVVTCLLGLATAGYASYVNIMIAYDQQKQLIEEGIKNGTYDPVTRRPIDEIKAVEKNESEIRPINDKQNHDLDRLGSNNDDVSLGTSGLVS